MSRNLSTLANFAEKHEAFTEKSLRWLRFNQTTNGFAPAFVNVGRRVLIDEDCFFECVDRLNDRGSSEPDTRTSSRSTSRVSGAEAQLAS